MRSVILHCPHLGRDVSGILAAVPGAQIRTGLPTPRGEDGCLEMHKSVVREAQAQNLQSVWAIEDDCGFTPAFDLARWSRLADWAQAEGFDLLVGGCTRTYKARPVREDLLEVDAFHSAHCVVYFQSSYEKVIQAVQPYDLSLGKPVESNYQTTYCGCRVALAWPFVAVQRPSVSGILGKPVNYLPAYERHEQELGRMFDL